MNRDAPDQMIQGNCLWLYWVRRDNVTSVLWGLRRGRERVRLPMRFPGASTKTFHWPSKGVYFLDRLSADRGTRSSWGIPNSHTYFPGGGVLCCPVTLWEENHTLHTVIFCSIFRLQAANGEGEICARSTALEPGWDPTLQSGCLINEEFRSLPWLLLIPV